MQTYQFQMPAGLEKDLKKAAKKQNLINDFKTELCFTTEYSEWWFTVSNWGIIMPIAPPRNFPNYLTQKDFSKIRYGKLGSNPLFAQGAWGTFKISFLKENRIQFKTAGKSVEHLLSSHLHLVNLETEKGVDDKGGVVDKPRYFQFDDSGFIEIFKNIYERYNS